MRVIILLLTLLWSPIAIETWNVAAGAGESRPFPAAEYVWRDNRGFS